LELRFVKRINKIIFLEIILNLGYINRIIFDVDEKIIAGKGV